MIKLLYVEDEPNLAKIVSETLSSRQFEVKLITRGDQALHAFNEFQPDICVLDVMLPHLDGYAVSKQIRNQDKKYRSSSWLQKSNRRRFGWLQQWW